MRSPGNPDRPSAPAPLRAGLLLLAALLAGCAFGGANQPVQLPPPDEPAPPTAMRAAPTVQPPINTSRNLYEGSLWKGAASWGNLLRDHRARYRGDLLTVAELPKLIKVPA